jgi:hypothetical protein
MQYTVHLGDSLPIIEATLRQNGVVYDLTAATSVTLRYRLARGTVVTEKTCTVVPPTSTTDWLVRYSWQAGDLPEPGNYLAEWRVALPGAGQVTWPNTDSKFAFVVTPAL